MAILPGCPPTNAHSSWTHGGAAVSTLCPLSSSPRCPLPYAVGEGLGGSRRSRSPETVPAKPGVSDAKRRIPLDLPLFLDSALPYPGLASIPRSWVMSRGTKCAHEDNLCSNTRVARPPSVPTPLIPDVQSGLSLDRLLAVDGFLLEVARSQASAPSVPCQRWTAWLA